MPTFAKFLISSLIFFQLPTLSAATSNSRMVFHDDPLVYAHLVVQGWVREVTYTTASLDEWGVEPKHSVSRIVREVAILHVDIESVIKGEHKSDVLEVAVFNSEAGWVQINAPIILAVFYNLAYGSYTIRNTSGVFLRSADGWVQESNKSLFQIETITSTVATSHLEHVTREAEVIVKGSVVEIVDQVCDSEHASAACKRVTLEIDSVLKGEAGHGQMTFYILSPEQNIAPNIPLPVILSVGEVRYVFLKDSELGFYAFAGSNGLLEIKDTEIYYDNSVPYYLSTKQFTTIIDEIVMEAE